MSQPKAKRTKLNPVRKANFTQAECNALVEQLKASPWLFNNQKGHTTDERNSEWARIVDVVNGIGGNNREVADIKKKWSEIKNNVKGKVADRKKIQKATGGGSPSQTPQISTFERSVEEMLPTTSVEGIAGGLDFAANFNRTR